MRGRSGNLLLPRLRFAASLPLGGAGASADWRRASRPQIPSSLPASASITTPISASSTCQARGRAKTGAKSRAP